MFVESPLGHAVARFSAELETCVGSIPYISSAGRSSDGLQAVLYESLAAFAFGFELVAYLECMLTSALCAFGQKEEFISIFMLHPARVHEFSRLVRIPDVSPRAPVHEILHLAQKYHDY